MPSVKAGRRLTIVLLPAALGLFSLLALASQLATRALLVVVFVVALAVLASATFPGYFQSQAPVLFEYMPVPASPPGYSPQSRAKRAR